MTPQKSTRPFTGMFLYSFNSNLINRISLTFFRRSDRGEHGLAGLARLNLSRARKLTSEQGVDLVQVLFGGNV